MTSAAVVAGPAPDLVEPFIGYRYWRIDESVLCSPFMNHRWARGVNAARCVLDAGHPDPPPGHGCVCGIHAWYRPCPRLGYATRGLVGGAVALWGAVELHATGLRAQYATVVALVLPLAHTGKRRRLVEIADALEVDVVPARQLTQAALRHGLPVAEGLAPSPA
jgi:hypothetical protein